MLVALVFFSLVGSPSFAQVPDTPCPDLFQYVEGDFQPWSGLVRVHSPERGHPLKLTVQLYLEAILPSKDAGRLILADGKDEVAQKLMSGSNERIRYKLEFPIPYPVPHIDRIAVNGEVVCVGPVVKGRVITKISLEHTLYPTVTTLSVPSDNGGNPFLQQRPPPNGQRPIFQRPSPNGQRPIFQLPNFQLPAVWYQPSLVPSKEPEEPLIEYGQESNVTPEPPPKPSTTRSPPTPKPAEVQESDMCGQSVTANQLVLNGKQTLRGEWPWLVAIFINTELGSDFRCSGTLINRRYVLTAAHCVKSQRNEPALNPEDLVLYLGKYNVRRFAEPDVQPREIERVIVHPDYGLTTSFDADIAILRLSMPAEYTRYVIPICMWNRGSNLASVVGQKGMVVGWGRDEKGNKVTDEPRLAQVPIVSQDKCLFSQEQFIPLTSNRTFCGGFRNETGPCNGDSGSGLVLPYMDGTRQRWYIRGIVSFSLFNKEENRCDLSNYLVFTDVAKHLKWLSQFTE